MEISGNHVNYTQEIVLSRWRFPFPKKYLNIPITKNTTSAFAKDEVYGRPQTERRDGILWKRQYFPSIPLLCITLYLVFESRKLTRQLFMIALSFKRWLREPSTYLIFIVWFFYLVGFFVAHIYFLCLLNGSAKEVS